MLRSLSTVGLVQINKGFADQNYLPYAVGLLESYVRKFATDPDHFNFLLPIYKRTSVEKCVKHLEEADVVGFSFYIWNQKISLEIARLLKKINPNILIVFGGPQVPHQTEPFLRSNPFIDIVVQGEGEKVFLRILETSRKGWKDLSAVSFIDDKGKFVHKPKVDRLELQSLPSPYLENTFEPLMEANPNETWLCLWETNRGCPFLCTFCDWGAHFVNKVIKFEMGRLMAELDWFSQHKIHFLYSCDANFGILARDEEIAQKVARNKEIFGFPVNFAVQNTKNSTERAYRTQKILNDSGLIRGVNLALQSTDSTTLKLVKRSNIKLESFNELQRRFTRDGIHTFTDLILGLPGETYESFVKGMTETIENGQHNRIILNLLSVMPNTEMVDPEYSQQAGLEMVELPTIGAHEFLESFDDEINETQNIVVATASMPKADWVKAKVFGSMTNLLFFNKLLQIPILVAHSVSGYSIRAIIDTFLNVDSKRFPIIKEAYDFFIEKTRLIQTGKTEFEYSKNWLGIYWPLDEYILIKLSIEESLPQFYEEAETLLGELMGEQIPAALLENAVRLNKALIKQPFQNKDKIVNLDYDVHTFYQSILRGERSALEQKNVAVRVESSKNVWPTWENWMKEVIWYCNRNGDYIYQNVSIDYEGSFENSKTVS